mgnify:CR=1 FL=1
MILLFVALSGRLKLIYLFGLFTDTAVLKLFFEIEILFKDAISLELVNTFLPAQAIIHLFIYIINHDVFPMLKFKNTQNVPEILFHIFILKFINILIFIFLFFFVFRLARIFRRWNGWFRFRVFVLMLLPFRIFFALASSFRSCVLSDLFITGSVVRLCLVYITFNFSFLVPCGPFGKLNGLFNLLPLKLWLLLPGDQLLRFCLLVFFQSSFV